MELNNEITSEKFINTGFRNIVISTDNWKETITCTRTNVFDENQFQRWKEAYRLHSSTSLNVIKSTRDAEHYLFLRRLMCFIILNQRSNP